MTFEAGRFRQPAPRLKRGGRMAVKMCACTLASMKPGTEALGDGLRGRFYGFVEPRGVSRSDLGAERGSSSEPGCRVPRRGHMAGIWRVSTEASMKAGAGSEFARRGNLDATCASGPRLLRSARKDDPSRGSIRSKPALAADSYFARCPKSLFFATAAPKRHQAWLPGRLHSPSVSPCAASNRAPD